MVLENIFNDKISDRQIEIDQIIRDYWIVIESFTSKLYTINDDGSIDVDGSVKFPRVSNYITQLPLTFNKVSSNFNCSKLSLTTLKGSPVEVGGYFDCSYNNLTSLEFAPKKVNGTFCFDNMVNTLFTGEIICDFDHVLLLKRTNVFNLGLPDIIIKNLEYLKIIFRYQHYYEVWNPCDMSLNIQAFYGLMEDILDGLE